jgi:hypothetical protein
LVLAFHRFEKPQLGAVAVLRCPPRIAVVAAVGFLVAGLGGLASFGFNLDARTLGMIVPVPVVCSILALAGSRLLTGGGRRPVSGRTAG